MRWLSMYRILPLQLVRTPRVCNKSNQRWRSWCTKSAAERTSSFFPKWIIYANHIPTFRFIKNPFCWNTKLWSPFWKSTTKRCFKICVRSIVKSWISCIRPSCTSISKIRGNWYTIGSTRTISCSQTKEKTQLLQVWTPKSLSSVCLNWVMWIQVLKELVHKVVQTLNQQHQRVKTISQG